VSATSAAPPTCIACGAAPRRTFRLRGDGWLLQCPRCQLGWWDWRAFDPQAFYDRNYFQSAADSRGYDDYASLTPGLERTARARLRRIDACSVPHDVVSGGRARLLEIGCGTGVFLNVARQAGWDVAGVEVSAYAADEARRRGLDVRCAPVEELHLEEGAYDAVALWDAVEHLRDPAGVLRAAARALRPGGVLALSTGDVTSLCARLTGPRWHLFTLPEHLFFFSPAALRRLLGAAGCRLVRLTREAYWVPAAYVLERLRKTAVAGALPGRGVLVHLAAWAGRIVVPATLFDVLGVYAVRSAR
jgi:SAM-dependent methyltransferase